MKKIYIVLLLLLLSANGFSQVDKVENKLKSYFDKSYLSDGQIYRTMLTTDEVGEFQLTFFGNIRYRIALLSTLDAPNKIIFRVLDSERNLLFTNKDFDNTPQWDFLFTGTINCKIEVEIAPGEESSAIVLMMVGYQP